MYKKALSIASLLFTFSFLQPTFVKAQSDFNYKQNKDVAVIRFTGYIRSESSKLLRHYLTVTSNFKETLLIINSQGGVNTPTNKIIDSIKESPNTVTTYTTEKVNSNAVPIYCAGDKKLAAKNSSFLIHYGWADLARLDIPQDTSKFNFNKYVNAVKKRIEDYVTQCSNITVEELRSKLNNPQNNYHIILSSEQAKNRGIVDEVKTPDQLLQNSCFFVSINSPKIAQLKPDEKVTNVCKEN